MKQVFTKIPILQQFDLECHIRIETKTLGYAIGGVLNQLNSDHLIFNQGQWYPIAYFSSKIILVKIMYKTYVGELLAIIEAFKI